MYSTLIIVGNVGKDPEMRYTSSGKPVTTFSVATNREYTAGDGQKVKETTWFRITTWGKQAEVCNQYVTKGMKVLIDGRLTPDKGTGGPRVWTGNDGVARAQFEVNANVVRFLGGGKGGNSAPEEAVSEEADQYEGGLPPEDDIPF